jgi:plastocyanin
MRVLSALLALIALALATVVPLTAAGADVSGRVVDQEGKGVAHAVVFIQDADAPNLKPQPTARASMDQVNKAFVPGVLPVAVGTEVRFPNHDQIHHHVYSFSRTKRFELPLYKGQDAPPVLFDKAGVVKVGCNIHDWMSAVILVLPTSHFAMTNEQGEFVLEDAPAGAHTLMAWHERSRAQPQSTRQAVQIAGTGLADVTFQLALSPARSRPAIRGLRKDP